MKIAKIAIFLTGMIGLAMGGLMSISSLRSQQQEAQVQTYESLKSEAQVLVDQFFGAMEAVKNVSRARYALATSSLPYVTHVGIVNLQQNLPTEFDSLATQEQMQLGVGKDGKALDTLPDLALEERVLKALKANLSYGDLQIAQFSIGTYEPSDLSNREGIYIATPIYKMNNGVVDPTIISQINVTLLDPTKVMASLNKYNHDHRSAFLINRYGKVLAHSQSSFVGSELKKFDSLKEPIENLFLGAQTGMVTQYTSVDGRKEQVAFIRAGVYPFAIGAEQSISPAVLSAPWWSEQASSGAARQNLGTMMVIAAIALALFAGASIFVSRQLPSVAANAAQKLRTRRSVSEANENENSNSARNNTGAYAPSFQRWTQELKARKPEAPRPAKPIEKIPQARNINVPDESLGNWESFNNPSSQTINASTATPPEFTPPPAIARAAERAAESFVENRMQVEDQNQVRQESAKRILVAKDYEREFADRIKSNYTLETIERELTSVSSELSESPVLYFRYHRQTQNLNLASVAGEVQIPNYALMQAYIRKDIEQQVERLASEGRVASISNYAPVSKLMMANLNTAHFEAWVVTSDAEISGSSKMVGVIVILQAGFRSAQTRPVLASILKEAGNYLYAQTSKLRPRRYDDPKTASNRGLGLNNV